MEENKILEEELSFQEAEKAEEIPVEEELTAAQEIELLKTQLADAQDQTLRAMAEMQNTKRRADKEIQDARAYSTTNFARDLLSVLENLKRAEETIVDADIAENEIIKNLFIGLQMTSKELVDVFNRYGITQIKAEGEKFDHNFHQAISEVETADHPSGTVIQVLQTGYKIKDRLLRPAIVVVAKNVKTEDVSE